MEEKPQQHPIDKKVAALMDKDASTAGMLQALTTGYKLWDAEMNKQYKKLLSLLKGRDRDTLVAAQRAWLAFRDRELRLSDRVYGKLQGTMYLPMHASNDMDLVKRRTEELTGYVDLLVDGEIRR